MPDRHTDSRRSRSPIGIWIAVLIIALSLSSCGDTLKVPPNQADAATREQQLQTFVEAMKPRDSDRPVMVVLARNEATETTDFMLTHAVLRRADVADVQAVALHRGPVAMYPAFQVEVNRDLADFDRDHPEGADYVVVPAMDDANDPAITAWLQQQANKGARIIGVCAGVLVVGRTGLLDDRRFTTHWYFRETQLERSPNATYAPHQRYLVDRDVATTTGITASVPVMLALVEAIGGHDKAQTLADELGVSSWTPAHDSSQFCLNAKRMGTYILNKLTFWRHQTWRVDVQDGMDDIALALAADAWSRTGRVTVQATASGPVTLSSGLKLMAQPIADDMPQLPLTASVKPVRQLDRTLCEINQRFGAARSEIVMMEMEYPGSLAKCGNEIEKS